MSVELFVDDDVQVSYEWVLVGDQFNVPDQDSASYLLKTSFIYMWRISNLFLYLPFRFYIEIDYIT